MNNLNEILSLRNFSVNINNISILENLNFSVKAGEYISIIGPNGAGKSTLIKTIAGIQRHYEGVIELFGQNPINASALEIGYVPQVKTLDRNFPAIVIELIVSGITKSWNWRISAENRERALKALERVGLTHLANRSLNTLSGGELQRAYFARAIVGNPRILLLDEAASGVDTKAEADLILLIEEFQEETNAAVIAVTHDWNAAFHHSDRVLMINTKQLCFDEPRKAFCDENLRLLFGHIGHSHDMKFGGHHHD